MPDRLLLRVIPRECACETMLGDLGDAEMNNSNQSSFSDILPSFFNHPTISRSLSARPPTRWTLRPPLRPTTVN